MYASANRFDLRPLLVASLTILLAVIGLCAVADADEPKPARPAVATWSSGDTATTDSGAVRGLSLRDARRMGLTVRNITEAVRQLQADGRITSDTTDAEVAALVADKLYGENAAAWGNPAAVNWEAILAFIESLLPIILKIISLFSASVQAAGPPLCQASCWLCLAV